MKFTPQHNSTIQSQRYPLLLRRFLGMSLLWLIGIPHGLVYLGQRTQPNSFGDILRDQITFELCGIPYLLLVPFKRCFKAYLYSPLLAQRFILRIGLQVLWLVLLGVPILFLLPQVFYLLTGRGYSFETKKILSDFYLHLPVFVLGIFPVSGCIVYGWRWIKQSETENQTD